MFITAPSLRVSNGAVMDARTANNQPGGDIRLDLGQLTLLSGGQINTTSEGPGPAGTIALTAQKQIQTSGTDSTYASRRTQFGTAVAPASANSGLYVRSTSTGAAGNILLTPPPAPPWISRAKSTRNRRLATAATWC